MNTLRQDPPRQVRVLVADGDPDRLSSLRALLDGQPRVELVGIATTAAEATELSRRHRPQLALIDAALLANAWNMAARIREVSPDTNIVALTERADGDTALGLLEKGAVGYLAKNCSPADLHTIMGAVAGQTVLPASDATYVDSRLVALSRESSRLREELDELRRTNSQILHFISNEFLAPATFIEDVARTLAHPTEVRTRGTVDVMSAAHRASVQLRRLLLDLSVTADLDSGSLRISPGPVTLDDLITDAAAHFPGERRLRLPIDPDLTRLTVQAAAPFAVRALVAVVESGLKSSPDDSLVDVSIVPHGDEVEIHVSDPRPGVPGDEIFELFAEDPGAGGCDRGMGIGLYLARRIMWAHGGRINVRATRGGGNDFVLVFRAFQDEPPTSSLTEEQAS